MGGEPFVHRVADLELEPALLDPETVLEGSPEVSELVLAMSEDGRVVRGVWQITPGVVRDVEADELFVVVSGRATVEVEGGPTLELEPGMVGVLRAGDRAVWRIHETLRKVFQITETDPPG
ncbi:MAG TPA: cupin domain-containing protein [Gaiellaceae bacterium]|nr:cupin domain-containing protein [Gaiellaceae bacterium]